MQNKVKKTIVGLGLFVMSQAFAGNELPPGFVYLHDVAPSILQDMRYATYHNFIGRPIKGYEAGECILTVQAADALAKVQAQLEKSHLSLKVYDCYRPQRAVNDFMQWSQKPSQTQMKAEFYPREDKAHLFDRGYIAAYSGHTRGSTMDLTIVALPAKAQAHYEVGQALVACYAPYAKRFADNSIDMGTGFDCLDETAYPSNKSVGKIAYQHRMLLRSVMMKYGFVPYSKEWWHFTLKNEPYPNTYFNFAVTARNQ